MVQFQRAVKTTIQILCYKGLFDTFLNADKILNDFFFVERRRLDLVGVNHVIQLFHSHIEIKK